jgi:hypothetical protein
MMSMHNGMETIKQELTVIEQREEWFAVLPDVKLATNQKTEG